MASCKRIVSVSFNRAVLVVRLREVRQDSVGFLIDPFLMLIALLCSDYMFGVHESHGTVVCANYFYMCVKFHCKLVTK